MNKQFPHVLVIVPARSGSKGIKDKNILSFRGKPLLAHAIDYAKMSSSVSNILVSTDSEEYRRVAEFHGASVLGLRPKHLSGDLVEDFPVCDYEVNEYEKVSGNTVDFVVWLRPTSPVRPPNLIEDSMELLRMHPTADSVRAVVETSEHHWRQWGLEGPFIRPIESAVREPFNLPRQSLPKTYFQSGHIEVLRRDTLKLGSISGRKLLPILISRSFDLDIDSVEDLENFN